MAKCAAINATAGSAETMVNTVDCYMQSTVQAGYANLLGPGSVFGYALTIALTIYVAIVGYRLIFGRSSLSMGEMAPRMLLIGAVLALTSNWATYQILVYDVLTDGPQEIVSAVNPSAGQSSSVNQRVDMLSGRMVDLADACGLTKADSIKAVEAVFDTISTALGKGEEVRLVGFGTFSVAQRKASTGRNPRTGEPMNIKASSQPKFKAGKGLKDAVN